MNKMLLLLSVASLALCDRAAGANLHWKGPDGVFEEMSSWTENNKVPTAEDFIIVKNYSGANWSVSLTKDETSWKSELGTPKTNFETVFKLNGHTWALTYDIHMGELTSGGGRIAFTNGTLRAPSLSFVPSVTNILLLSMNNVTCEVGTTEYGFTRATFEGGNLRVTNLISVGKPGYRAATVTFDKGARVSVSNTFVVGDAAGATGELFNVNGQFEYRGSNSFYIGRAGYGSMTVGGGSTLIQFTPCVGYTNTGVGFLTVAGGSNTFGTVGENKLNVGHYGRGTVLGYGGTNTACGLTFGYTPGGYGEMALTNGSWTFSNYSWIGYYGKGVISMTGGTMYSPSAFCIGRAYGGTGVVTVAGGTLDVNAEVRLGGASGSYGSLALSGTGVLKAGFISELEPGAMSRLLFDGGTLQPKWNLSSGALIRSVDDIRLTANGLVLDTAGYNVTITGLLQNATGEAGSITKKGAGTLTLAGARTATGAVSVLGGTLVMSDNVTVSAGASRIDGTLTLTADSRLNVGTGASLAGTGMVARVTLQDNAVFARAKADNAATPLLVNDCVADNRLTVALTGYTLEELKTAVPLIRMPTTSIDIGKVTATLNGQTNPFLFVKYVSDGGQLVLSVSYSAGTLIRLF
jgi:autotransporter-associated beta strand protein